MEKSLYICKGREHYEICQCCNLNVCVKIHLYAETSLIEQASYEKVIETQYDYRRYVQRLRGSPWSTRSNKAGNIWSYNAV